MYTSTCINVVLNMIFMLNILLQLLTIHLDESDIFSAWVSSIRELGINPPLEWEDCKGNIEIHIYIYAFYDINPMHAFLVHQSACRLWNFN